jgi:hypothetical protein
MHLFDLAIMITTSTPAKGSGTPNQLLGVQPHAIACSKLSRVRTELRHLLSIPLRHIQYIRTASLRAMPTLAIFRPRLIVR